MPIAEQSSVELNDRRMAVMSDLTECLTQAEVAIARMDVAALEQHCERQFALCREWVAAQSDQKAVSDTPPLLGSELENTAQRLHYRTRVHAALLRRMRRAILVLENMSVGPTSPYAAPVASGEMPSRTRS